MYECKIYEDFFRILYSEVEKNVIARITSNKLDWDGKNYVQDASRIFQLIQIIKRLSNADMASFKFAINFGVNTATKDIINDVLLSPKAVVQEKLEGIVEEEIFILFKYLELCKFKEAKVIENLGTNSY